MNFDQIHLMGIVNVTPDSFSDGGKFIDKENAFNHINNLVINGASIVDIGAESTRPGAELVPAEEEWNRLEPLLELIDRRQIKVKISIDTRKPLIAQKAISLGASIINDVSSLEEQNGKIAEIVAQNSKASLVLNHHRGIPPTKNNPEPNPNIIEEVIDFFEQKIILATKKGVTRKQLILDPGLGFGKGVEENLLIIDRLAEIKKHFHLPIMIGPSRKRFIKELWGELSEESLDWGSMVISLLGAKNGATIIRCHEPRLFKPITRD